MVFMTKGAGRTVYKGKLCTVEFKPKTLFSFCLYRDNKKVPTQTFTHSNPPPPVRARVQRSIKLEVFQKKNRVPNETLSLCYP